MPITPEALNCLGGRVVEDTPRAACLTFSGSYDRAATTYIELRQWMKLTGTRAAGPLRETYLRFAADQRGYQLPERFLAREVAEYRTQLQVPILRARARRHPGPIEVASAIPRLAQCGPSD